MGYPGFKPKIRSLWREERRGTVDGQAGHREVRGWGDTAQWGLFLMAPQIFSNMNSPHRPGMVEFLLEAGGGAAFSVGDNTRGHLAG